MVRYPLDVIQSNLERAEDAHDSFAFDYWYCERENYYRENRMSRKDVQLENFYAAGL